MVTIIVYSDEQCSNYTVYSNVSVLNIGERYIDFNKQYNAVEKKKIFKYEIYESGALIKNEISKTSTDN